MTHLLQRAQKKTTTLSRVTEFQVTFAALMLLVIVYTICTTFTNTCRLYQ